MRQLFIHIATDFVYQYPVKTITTGENVRLAAGNWSNHMLLFFLLLLLIFFLLSLFSLLFLLLLFFIVSYYSFSYRHPSLSTLSHSPTFTFYSSSSPPVYFLTSFTPFFSYFFFHISLPFSFLLLFLMHLLFPLFYSSVSSRLFLVLVFRPIQLCVQSGRVNWENA